MITYHRELIQGSDEWHAARCGLITASEIKLLITPTMKMAANDKQRAHVWELAAQRATKYTEPGYVSSDMLRGHDDEIEARALYAEHFAPVDECGFVTNDEWGFTLGCSPDGLVGEDGGIECKSRCQKYQMQTILSGEMPVDFLLQVQTEMLVCKRAWWDFVSYCGGMPLFVKRVHADATVQSTLVAAAAETERQITEALRGYNALLPRMIPTERKIVMEMYI